MGKFPRHVVDTPIKPNDRTKACEIVKKAKQTKVKEASNYKSVKKPAVKLAVLPQSPVGMANSTKGSPYIPPAKKNTKPKL